MEITKSNELKRMFGTSFHNATFNASVDELTTLLGEENVGASGDGKCKHEWFVKTNEDKYFSIYDWKEYRDYPSDEIINWHIGSKYGETEDEQFADAMKQKLHDLRTKE